MNKLFEIAKRAYKESGYNKELVRAVKQHANA